VEDWALRASAFAAPEAEEAASDAQFLGILEAVLQQVPSEAEVRGPLRSGMIRHWLTPPVADLRLMLGEEALGLLEAKDQWCNLAQLRIFMKS
jgi:hypothetical protein